VLSFVSNSTSTERLFSSMGNTNSKSIQSNASSNIIRSSSKRRFTSWPSNGIAGPSRLAPLNSSLSSDEIMNNDRSCNTDVWALLYDTVKEDLGHEWGFDSLNLAAALELQEYFDTEDLQLRDQIQTLAGSLPHSFSCAICMEEQPVDNSVDLECDHSICRTCIRGHIFSKIEEHRFPIMCPVCVIEKNNRQPAGLYILRSTYN